MNAKELPEFRRSAADFLRFVRAWRGTGRSEARPTDSDATTAVFVCPWLETAVPWFNLALAMLLRHTGHRILVVEDDLPFEDNAAEHAQTHIIHRVLRRLEPDFEIQPLSRLGPEPLSASERIRLRELARSNLIRARMSSVGIEQQHESQIHIEKRLADNFARIKALAGRRSWRLFVAPGGLYANSGLYLLLARHCGIRAATYDAGYGRLFIGTDDVACYFEDDVRTFREVLAYYPVKGPEISAVNRHAHAEFEARLAGSDALRFQTVPSGESIATSNYDVLIPMSIDWDAPGLGRNRFFETPAQWVHTTVRWILENTTARVAFRQHPYIRHVDWWNGEDGYFELLRGLLEAYPERFHFFRAEDRINTYELVQCSRIILPYVSAIGIEAVFMGKPVIVESTVHYSHLPFCIRPDSLDDYFHLIKEGIAGRLSAPDETARAEALLYYHIFQSAHYLMTDFTPQPADFTHWVRQPFIALARRPTTVTALRAITSALPVAQQHLFPTLQPTAMALAPSPTQDFKRFPDVSFGQDVQIIGMANATIGSGSCIGDSVWINVCNRDAAVRLKIGRCVLVGRRSMLSSGEHLEIGDYCLLAPQVYVSSADHIYTDIHRPIVEQGATLNRRIVLEENCWLGINAVVSGNLTVGRGSVVAANAVVTRDVPPFCVVAGNPARIIKMYDPREQRWMATPDEADIRRIMTHRTMVPLPPRAEYAAKLVSLAQIKQIDPIVAGRGACI